jgi:ATP-binding protein involved in chromosome partitioning
MLPSSDQVIDALRPVQDPELHRSIVDLGMVRDVTVKPDGVVSLRVALTVPGCPLRHEIQSRVDGAVRALPDVRDVAVDFTVMTDAEREALRDRLHGDPGATAGHGPAHGHAEGRRIPFAEPGSTTRPLLISSGKGGVGKSSVTTNLAVALAQRGHSVGVLDADVYGFSIPRMLGADRDPVVIDQMLLPPEAWGVRCISMAYFVPDGQAVIWRGPMLHKALEQFLTDVYWDNPDFLLVDMPPGTGDIAISLSQYLPRAEVYVVTTPQPAAEQVARLSAAMAAKVHMEVKGVIENMSWFTGDDGTRYELFGRGGGQSLADELGVPLLAQIPLLPPVREGSDEGKPVVAVDPDSEAGRTFTRLAERVAVELRPKKVFRPELTIR